MESLDLVWLISKNLFLIGIVLKNQEEKHFSHKSTSVLCVLLYSKWNFVFFKKRRNVDNIGDNFVVTVYGKYNGEQNNKATKVTNSQSK